MTKHTVNLLLSASVVSLVSLLELNSHKSESVHSSDSSPALSFAGGGRLASFTALPIPPKIPRRLGLALLGFGDEDEVSLDMLESNKQQVVLCQFKKRRLLHNQEQSPIVSHILHDTTSTRPVNSHTFISWHPHLIRSPTQSLEDAHFSDKNEISDFCCTGSWDFAQTMIGRRGSGWLTIC